jgi:1,4-alpha-glucan branching enzyme
MSRARIAVDFPTWAIEGLEAGTLAEPHAVLGAHATAGGVVVRARHPAAVAAEVLHGDATTPMEPFGAGAFAAVVPDAELPLRYRLRWHFADGGVFEADDPYRFLPTVGDHDLHFFGEGRHLRLWQALGARELEMDGVGGTAFSLWAPNARRVSVLGDFTHWDARVLPMRTLGASGVWELFVPGVHAGVRYKFEVLGADGRLVHKSDPMARQVEVPPATASIVHSDTFRWGDREWMEDRLRRNPHAEPMSVYEVHLGSWRRGLADYRAVADDLANHVAAMGFTHIELLPVTAHPFDGSWGYQTSGYFAPAAQYGDPDGLRTLVDTCHRRGVGVILDWVPAHFPRDEFSLARFDGTALYEHEDPRLGAHPDWGTLIFNYGRNEVRNFLIASALFWLGEYHFDGIRVDAVASMLYRDYSRAEGEWVPNRFGGRENLEAVDFLRDLNRTIAAEAPGAVTVAEESTAWPGVSRSVDEGGLGFTFKWNMGWMHDTLEYFERDPVHRSHHHNELTFAGLYDRHEYFMLPLSHDEVVHGKRSLLARMPGDDWQRLANLRLLLAWQWLRPGKQLLFMGSELAPETEWNHEAGLDWGLARDPARAAFLHYVACLGRLYREQPPLWAADHDDAGTEWIAVDDQANSVIAFARHGHGRTLLVACNFTPVPRTGYRVGAPHPGRWNLLLNGDAGEFGGSAFDLSSVFDTEPVGAHGREHSLVLSLPPLAAVVLG